jgi:hypothetical protein
VIKCEFRDCGLEHTTFNYISVIPTGGVSKFTRIFSHNIWCPDWYSINYFVDGTELQMSQITDFIYQYRKNWKEHVDRMSSDRIPMILKYQPKGKRNLGRPLKRWKDSVL